MPLQIDIPDDNTDHLNQQAKDELVSSIRGYIAEVLDEANRLEAANNTTGRDPQIISSMISDAVLLLRRGYRKPRKPYWLRGIQVISAVSSAIFGVMFDYEKMKEPTFVILLLIVFATALATTIFVVMNE